MNTEQAFSCMAERYCMQNDLVKLASIDSACTRMIAYWFSNAVLMADTARHDAFAELIYAQATGQRTAWTVDSVANVEISANEIPAIYRKFVEIVQHVSTKILDNKTSPGEPGKNEGKTR